MENKASKKIKWLMVVILLLFLIPSAIDFVDGFSEGWQSFEKGREEGSSGELDYQHFYVRIEPTGITETAQEVGNGHRFIPSRETGELLLAEPIPSAWWVKTLGIFLALAGLVTLVWFVVELIRFATKIPRRRIMAEDNIHSLRRIAYSLGIFSLCMYLTEGIEILWLRGQVSLEGYEFSIILPPASLIVSLIILVMTEILKLGHGLEQEQELTI